MEIRTITNKGLIAEITGKNDINKIILHIDHKHLTAAYGTGYHLDTDIDYYKTTIVIKEYEKNN